MSVGMCVGLCVDMCVDMCVGMRQDTRMHAGTCVGMRATTHVEMCTDIRGRHENMHKQKRLCAYVQGDSRNRRIT